MIELLLAAALTISVHDGDSLTVNGTSYRLVGYDTPELTTGKCVAERRLASQARRRLIALTKVPGAKLTQVECNTVSYNYGRSCAVITIDGKNIAGTMVREGLADDYWCGSSGCPRRRSWCEVDRK